MQFRKSKLEGAYLIQAERIEDSRGFFATTFSDKDFEAHGLNTVFRQSSTSFNHKIGTIRGMHFQLAPHTEAKIVRCSAGTIFDVIVDLREDSSTYGKWDAAELSAENMLMFFVPEGFAHGYQTLTDNVEVFYQLSQTYHAQSAQGVHHADPTLGIQWPLPISIVSEKDLALPLLKNLSFGRR